MPGGPARTEPCPAQGLQHFPLIFPGHGPVRLGNNVISAEKDGICQAATQHIVSSLPSQSKTNPSLSHEYFFPSPRTGPPGHRATITVPSSLFGTVRRGSCITPYLFCGRGVTSLKQCLINCTLSPFPSSRSFPPPSFLRSPLPPSSLPFTYSHACARAEIQTVKPAFQARSRCGR